MSAARTALLYARTLRTLRPVQVAARAWRLVHRPRADLSPAPPLRRAGRLVAGVEQEPVLLSATRVRLLGSEREVAAPADWDPADRPRLWRYHLHYLDDLHARGAAGREAWQRDLLARWLRDNPPGRRPAWEPYPLSRRVANLARASLLGRDLGPDALHALAVQARWLRGSLEHHLLGNHLLANARALALAGVRFGGAEGDAWLAKGLALLRRELDEQVLEDGGHFERSPLYHARVLEDLLDVLAALEAADLAPRERGAWRARAQAMRRWLAAMTHPDGEIALFNDAALDAAAAPAALEAYAARLGLPPLEQPDDGAHALAATGYVRLQHGATVALVDVGEIGPRYLPGHAHADTLSFELSLGGRRLVVDSGTSTYEPGTERRRQRSTAAHNTVEVDGQDSSEVWGAFRVARRARPREVSVAQEGQAWVVRAAHDGYRRLPGRVLHRRALRLAPDALELEDALEGSWTSAVARLHLHPAVRVLARGARLAHGATEVRVASAGCRAAVLDATWHPRFGETLPSACLAFALDGPRARVRLEW